MTPATEPISPPTTAAWFGAVGPTAQTRLFRRTFDLDQMPIAADLQIFGEGKYHLWVNGHYLGRGPIFRHPFHIYIDTYPVAALLSPGINVLAALVHTPGLGMHNHIPAGHPALACRLDLHLPDGKAQTIDTDDQWRVTDQTGWLHPTPRRGWALSGIEHYDAAAAPDQWQTATFDDSTWHRPDLSPLGAKVKHATIHPRPLPDLRYTFKPVVNVVGFEMTTHAPSPINAQERTDTYGLQLLDAGFTEPTGDLRMEGNLDAHGGGLRVEGLAAQRGAAIHFDLGCEYVGQPVFEIESDSTGIIDFANGELLDDGRTAWLRKGTSYADRIHAKAGITCWEPIGIGGFRYLTLMLRGFEGSVTINRLGARTSEPDIPWRGRFDCDNQTLTNIFRLCEHTIRVGTQEGLMDCPTREQAPYIGDGHPVAHWIAMLTGDLRHWQYLTAAQFARQAASGLIRSTPFSWYDHALIDYNLIAIIGTRDYLRCSGDPDTPRAVLPAARRVFAWFDSHCNDQDLFALDWRSMRGPSIGREEMYDPDHPKTMNLNLFIDHAGMGWHNVGEPGIDRNGLNAAINMLIIRARRALADMEEAVGDPTTAAALRDRADAQATTARKTFFDPKRGYFLDGICDGKPLTQISEQTNIWAILAGCCSDDEARTIIRRMLAEGDPDMARSGPYFCLYLLDAMARLGLHREALDLIVARWQPMIDGGATAAWESFNGDQYDTWCHPWSAAPVAFLLAHVLGLPDCATATHLTLRPRFDLMDEASGAVHSPRGPIEIGWQTQDNIVTLHGVLPEGVTAEVVDPNNPTRDKVTGQWRQEYPR